MEKSLNTGNYDTAIQLAIQKLRTNKDKKRKQPQIEMLETAFQKATARDLDAIRLMKKENTPANLDRIYNTYAQLRNRQEKIKPLLPLYLVKQGRKAEFSFRDYKNELVAAKKKLTTHLYENANARLKTAKSKQDYRAIYEDLDYLSELDPGYKNTEALKEEVLFKGTDFVLVSLKNKTNVIIPKRLEADLLNFNTYGLNDLWTVYHGISQKSIPYDYSMELELRDIDISPEQVKERQLEREKTVVDGWEYLTDSDGEYILDEDGNKIKQDILVTVLCEYYEFTQFKAVRVAGNVIYRNLKTRQVLDKFPLASEHIFEHRYANYNGDKRALDDDYVRYLGLQAVKFPTNEQMVYDSGEDLKNKLKSIISRYRF